MAPQISRGCCCERYSNNCDGYSVQITAKGMFSQQSKVVVAWFRWKLIEKIRKNSQPWCWLPDRKKNCKWLYISLLLRIDWPVVFKIVCTIGGVHDFSLYNFWYEVFAASKNGQDLTFCRQLSCRIRLLQINLVNFVSGQDHCGLGHCT